MLIQVSVSPRRIVTSARSTRSRQERGGRYAGVPEETLRCNRHPGTCISHAFIGHPGAGSWRPCAACPPSCAQTSDGDVVAFPGPRDYVPTRILVRWREPTEDRPGAGAFGTDDEATCPPEGGNVPGLRRCRVSGRSQVQVSSPDGCL